MEGWFNLPIGVVTHSLKTTVLRYIHPFFLIAALILRSMCSLFPDSQSHIVEESTPTLVQKSTAVNSSQQ